MSSLAISVDVPILDENNLRLNGSSPSSGYFGIPYVVGDLVHTYLATDGVIYAADTNGIPDSRNILLKSVAIGIGTAPNEINPGKFSCIVSPRPPAGSRLFVRVFNASHRASSSYYADSPLYTLNYTVNETFMAQFPNGMRPLDTSDNDADGMINSMEVSIGTDVNNPDTDNDGITDRDELTAGTDPSNAQSVLMVYDMLMISQEQWVLSWPTANDRIYSIERMDGLDENATYSGIKEVIGNGSVREVVFPFSASTNAFFRIIARQKSEPE